MELMRERLCYREKAGATLIVVDGAGSMADAVAGTLFDEMLDYLEEDGFNVRVARVHHASITLTPHALRRSSKAAAHSRSAASSPVSATPRCCVPRGLSRLSAL